MKLKSFNPEIAPSSIRTGKAVLSVSLSGAISISQTLAEAMNLTDEDHIELHQDETAPKDWYISKTANGFVIRKEKNSGRFIFNSAATGKAFFEAAGDQFEGRNTASCLVATKPVKNGKADLFPIFMSSVSPKTTE